MIKSIISKAKEIKHSIQFVTSAQYKEDKKSAKLNPDLIRINYKGFWAASPEYFNGFYLKTFLPDHEKRTVVSSYKPDILFYSTFAKRPSGKAPKNQVRFFWTGEDVQNNHTDFKDNLIGIFDASFGFDYIDHPKYVRFPLWILYYFEGCQSKDQIKQRIDSLNSREHNPKNFAALIARHDKNGIRTKITDLAEKSSGTKVNCAGAFNHNDDDLIKKYDDNKIRYLESFMFNICPENTNTPGYVTEKLFQSIDAGCIPLYWGCENPEPQVINPRAILNLAAMSEEDFSNQIHELWSNKKYYNEFISNKPILDSAVDYIFEVTQKAKQLMIDSTEKLFR